MTRDQNPRGATSGRHPDPVDQGELLGVGSLLERITVRHNQRDARICAWRRRDTAVRVLTIKAMGPAAVLTRQLRPCAGETG